MKLKGFKGDITLDGKKSKVLDAYLMSPSAHHYGGQQFDMELQINTAETTLVTFIKAKKGEGNSFLQSIGFSSGGIRALEVGKKVQIGEVGNLSHMLTTRPSFLSYEGEQLFGKCRKTTFIINPDIVFCGLTDLKELEDKNHKRELNAFFLKERAKTTKIYQNYEPPEKGHSKTFTHRPKADIEREKKAKKKKEEALKKARRISNEQMV